MSNFNTKLGHYADLIVKVGLNIQNGQDLLVNAPISAASFVQQVAIKAYKAGAKNVLVEYSDEELTKTKLEMAPEEGLTEFPQWKAKGYFEMAENNVALLNIKVPNPTLLKDVDPKRVAIANNASGKAMKDFRKYTGGGRISWLIASIPTKEWATSVFPELDEDRAIDKLWDYIFYTTRIHEEDPVLLWEEHIERLNKNADYLNRKKYKKLHYTGPGTNLTIELPTQSKWMCAQFTNDQGISYVPNLPTEEVFTIPVKTGVNGVVNSTKPLNYAGNLIKNFSLTFKNGKVVDFTAEEGYETLENLLRSDEGASYLGEVALVPHDSPISNTGIIFNNTLYDENASCHIALGNALSICVEDGKKMSKEVLQSIGFNDSIVHVDFMIGSKELDIDGELEDGKIEPIFRNGNWARL
jgi:aminopeptidase